jgi:hypothetical protein
MHMFINDKFVCTSSAVYGTRNEGGMGGAAGGEMGPMSGHSHGGSKQMVRRYPQAPKKEELLTVSSMSDCEGPWKVKKGDTVVLKAEYDLKKHPL